MQVGDQVVAIGNALALGDTPTVTTGIVSAKGRTLEDGQTTLKNLIQTDAAINHGNSGGPLLNAAGQVVGINSAGIPDAENLGFAIEIDAIRPLIDELKSGKDAEVKVAGLPRDQQRRRQAAHPGRGQPAGRAAARTAWSSSTCSRSRPRPTPG